MRKQPRSVFMILLGLMFFISAMLMIRQFAQYRNAQQTQALALELAYASQSAPPELLPSIPEEVTPATQQATLPEETEPLRQIEPLDENVLFLFDTDLTQLQQVNEDVLGWIHIPDTNISFPLMRSYDNEDYLYQSWDGSYSISGSIFLECKNNRDLLDFNTIIYGHHIRNGTIFASLLNYKEQAFRDAHPYVYILTETDLRRYRVFSAYEAPVDSDTYRLYFPDDVTKQTAISHYVNSSLLEQELTPTTSDYILTLSTCTGTGIYTTRWVVQCTLDSIWPR